MQVIAAQSVCATNQCFLCLQVEDLLKIMNNRFSRTSLPCMISEMISFVSYANTYGIKLHSALWKKPSFLWESALKVQKKFSVAVKVVKIYYIMQYDVMSMFAY